MPESLAASVDLPDQFAMRRQLTHRLIAEPSDAREDTWLVPGGVAKSPDSLRSGHPICRLSSSVKRPNFAYLHDWSEAGIGDRQHRQRQFLHPVEELLDYAATSVLGANGGTGV